MLLPYCFEVASKVDWIGVQRHINSAKWVRMHSVIYFHYSLSSPAPANLSHNNVCPSSVFIAFDGRWKLGGFECAQDMQNMYHWVQSDFMRSIKNSEFAPPEDQLMLNTNISSSARDAFAFGKLIAYAMPYMQNHLPVETISALEALSRCLTDADAAKRAQLGGVAKSHRDAFKNNLSMVVEFLQTIHLSTQEQKTHFFKNAINWLRGMPLTVIGRRLVPLLLSRYVLLEKEAHSVLLPFILRPSDLDNGEQIRGLLPLSEYRRWVIPELIKIFHVHETSVRLALHAHFPIYVQFFTRTQLENIVLPELVLGMRDTDDRIVGASLHAMAHLVAMLGGPAVTGLAHNKSFADGTPRKMDIRLAERAPLSTTSPLNVPVQRCEMAEELDGESLSPSSHLSRLLSDDDIPEQSDLKLQLMSQTEDDFTEQRRSASVAQAAEWAGSLEEDWSVNWDEREEVNPSASPPSDASVSVSLNASDAAPYVADISARKHNIQLGAEYDVPEIGKVVTKNSAEKYDYFAGMEPVFAKTPSLIERLERKVVESAKQMRKATASRFAALPESECESVETNLGEWEAAVADWDAD
ncbi:unnamed protein product [Toxocara canis]|uniref:Protein kinase domain-containing protein n=1 Tax=Toxocara canis TaxID=6265 RepID=A0A183UHE1_TOXCA|nr:unnamed protein product [Toxocara canis]